MHQSFYFLFFSCITYIHVYGAARDDHHYRALCSTDDATVEHILISALSPTRPLGTIFTGETFYTIMDTLNKNDFITFLRTCDQPIRIEEDVYAFDHLFNPPIITASEEKLSPISHALYTHDYERALDFARAFPQDMAITDSYRRGPVHYLCSEMKTKYPKRNKNIVHQLLTLFKHQLNDPDSDDVQPMYKVTNHKLLLTLHIMGADFNPEAIRRYGLHTTTWNTMPTIAALHYMGISTEALERIFTRSNRFIKQAINLHEASLTKHMQEVGHYMLQASLGTTGSIALTLRNREYYGRESEDYSRKRQRKS